MARVQAIFGWITFFVSDQNKPLVLVSTTTGDSITATTLRMLV